MNFYNILKQFIDNIKEVISSHGCDPTDFLGYLNKKWFNNPKRSLSSWLHFNLRVEHKEACERRELMGLERFTFDGSNNVNEAHNKALKVGFSFRKLALDEGIPLLVQTLAVCHVRRMNAPHEYHYKRTIKARIKEKEKRHKERNFIRYNSFLERHPKMPISNLANIFQSIEPIH